MALLSAGYFKVGTIRHQDVYTRGPARGFTRAPFRRCTWTVDIVSGRCKFDGALQHALPIQPKQWSGSTGGEKNVTIVGANTGVLYAQALAYAVNTSQLPEDGVTERRARNREVAVVHILKMPDGSSTPAGSAELRLTERLSGGRLRRALGRECSQALCKTWWRRLLMWALWRQCQAAPLAWSEGFSGTFSPGGAGPLAGAQVLMSAELVPREPKGYGGVPAPPPPRAEGEPWVVNGHRLMQGRAPGGSEAPFLVCTACFVSARTPKMAWKGPRGHPEKLGAEAQGSGGGSCAAQPEELASASVAAQAEALPAAGRAAAPRAPPAAARSEREIALIAPPLAAVARSRGLSDLAQAELQRLRERSPPHARSGSLKGGSQSCYGGFRFSSPGGSGDAFASARSPEATLRPSARAEDALRSEAPDGSQVVEWRRGVLREAGMAATAPLSAQAVAQAPVRPRSGSKPEPPEAEDATVTWQARVLRQAALEAGGRQRPFDEPRPASDGPLRPLAGPVALARSSEPSRGAALVMKISLPEPADTGAANTGRSSSHAGSRRSSRASLAVPVAGAQPSSGQPLASPRSSRSSHASPRASPRVSLVPAEGGDHAAAAPALAAEQRLASAPQPRRSFRASLVPTADGGVSQSLAAAAPAPSRRAVSKNVLQAPSNAFVDFRRRSAGAVPTPRLASRRRRPPR
ncbi:unnamed protein product [Prorocentrum cordatum]|uniref:Uncharacterized protein n=1 Tax=Prorocentrum cordatum TaxID=2364126 RepID=A0ABN9X4C5_9DINO|nr:unnamed protein product [Polarella glacialis]